MINNMMSKNPICKKLIPLFLIFISVLIFNKTTYLDQNEASYFAPIFNQADASYFSDNVDVNSGTISSKWFTQTIESTFLRLGMDWGTFHMIVGCFSLFFQFLAFYILLSRAKVDKPYIPILILTFGFSQSIMGNIGFSMGFGLQAFNTLSLALALCGLFFCIPIKDGKKPQWGLGFLFCVPAFFIHAHNGLFGFVSISFSYIVNQVYQGFYKPKISHLLGFITCIVAIIFAIGPNVITDSTALTNQEFIDIYAIMRVPHHLLPSKWGYASIIIQIIIAFAALGIITFSLKLRQSSIQKETITLKETSGIRKVLIFLKNNEEYVISAGAVILIGVVIILQQFFIRVIPWAFYIKLYVPKFFMFFRYILLAYLTLGLYRLYRDKGYWTLFLAPLIIMSIDQDYSVVTILAALLIEYGVVNRRYRYTVAGIVLFQGVIILGGVSPSQKLVVYIAIILAFLFDVIRNKQRIVRAFLTTASLALALYSLPYDLIKSPELNVKRAVSEDIMELGETFESVTEPSEGFVADPFDLNAVWLEVVSYRNCYVTFKEIPATSYGVERWNTRLKEVRSFKTLNDIETKKLLENTGYQYALIPAERFDQFDESELFQKIDGNDKYAIYFLINTLEGK